ncbi:MAG: TatD family hydrolase [Candidatus Saccharimonadales bacterium]
MLIDTHAHIHAADYPLSPVEVLATAKTADVAKIICVGTDTDDSQLATQFAAKHGMCYATIGQHPHEAKQGARVYQKLASIINAPKVVAVGECGLDYYYEHSPRSDQKIAFRFQIELALEHKKPLIFHVRDQKSSDGTPTAFDDFFEILDEYKGINGVIHSFTSGKANLQKALKRNLYIGLNGIMTFTQDQGQLAAAKEVPLGKLVLETDAPFLAPLPTRGKPNQPAYVEHVAQFLSEHRGEPLKELKAVTTANAKKLFGI